MSLRSAAAAVVVLGVTTGFAQATSPATAPGASVATQQRAMPGNRFGRSAAPGKPGAVPTVTLQQRIQDMESTLASMHSVLTQMKAKAAASKSKDAVTKANLQMWDLMVSHLDKQLQELRTAELARQDFEARRAAMYKQADAKAEAQARAAQAAQAAEAARAKQMVEGTSAASPAAPASQASPETAPAAPASDSPAPH